MPNQPVNLKKEERRRNRKTSSFLRGVARVADPLGALNEPYELKKISRSESEGLAADWKAVGNDIRAALHKFERQQNAE